MREREYCVSAPSVDIKASSSDREEQVHAAQPNSQPAHPIHLPAHPHTVFDTRERQRTALGDEHLRGHAGRLRGDEAAEVLVRDLLRDLELALEHRQPALHQVDILQKGPAALARVAVEDVLAVLLLPLAHRDRYEVAVDLGEAELVAEGLDGFAGVDAGEEHKEEGRGRRRVLEGALHREGRLHHVALAHVFDDKGCQRGGHAVGAQRAHDEQLEEGRRLLLPIAGQLLTLGRRVLDPVTPAFHVELQVLSELREETERGEERW